MTNHRQIHWAAIIHIPLSTKLIRGRLQNKRNNFVSCGWLNGKTLYLCTEHLVLAVAFAGN